MSRPATAPERRFWPRVEKGDGCWMWRGAKHRSGHGHFNAGSGGYMLAHRFAYEQLVGPIPEGMVLCHRCDTPACVRPDHLFVGTQADNVADMMTKARGRGQFQSTDVCHRGHPRTPENTRVRPSGKRSCRPCENMMSATAPARSITQAQGRAG